MSNVNDVNKLPLELQSHCTKMGEGRPCFEVFQQLADDINLEICDPLMDKFDHKENPVMIKSFFLQLEARWHKETILRNFT